MLVTVRLIKRSVAHFKNRGRFERECSETQRLCHVIGARGPALCALYLMFVYCRYDLRAVNPMFEQIKQRRSTSSLGKPQDIFLAGV